MVWISTSSFLQVFAGPGLLTNRPGSSSSPENGGGAGVALRKRESGRITMYLSNQSIIVILVVGLVAGWSAGKIVRGAGFGLIADIVIGIIGAFIGDWLLPRLGIHLGTGTISLIVNATVG